MSKRELLKNELLNLKICGYRVFINKNDNENGSYLNYGLISDGTNILYVQFARLLKQVCYHRKRLVYRMTNGICRF